MFSLWGKTFHNNRLVKDYVANINDDDTRTHKVFKALAEICQEFNIEQPMWLEKNIREFQKFSHVRFSQDNFIEEINFDYLEIRILEDD